MQAISYIKTQIVKASSCVNQSLQCVDELGSQIATLNGVGMFYQKGVGIQVDLDRQGNYICLLDIEDGVIDSENLGNFCDILKQRTDEWFELRKGAVITGSSFYWALGLGTLKDQKAHYDKVFKAVHESVNPDLQKLFDHGTSNEVNALATFLAKIMRVYYPNAIYKGDGCVVKSMSEDLDAYAVISGDGTCIKKVENDWENIVAAEFKCPMPGKMYVPDVYYKLPPYYVCQILSQMNAKDCGELANFVTQKKAPLYSLVDMMNNCGITFGIKEYNCMDMGPKNAQLVGTLKQRT